MKTLSKKIYVDQSDQLIIFLVCGFFVTFFESYCSRRTKLFSHLSSKFNTINGDIYEPTTNNDYVYYHTNNMHFQTIKDPLFDISQECGILERNVQYCQWVEVVHSKTTVDSNNNSKTTYHYTYHKQWLHNQISSLFFKNPLYFNPQVPIIPSLSFRSSNIQAGAYIISPTMTLLGGYQKVVPEGSQIQNFEENKKVTDFQYAGSGIFYSSYKRGILDQLLRIGQFFDLQGDIVDWCTPGDRRVWFKAWKPSDATVVGKRLNNSIQPFIYQEYKVGSVQPGEIPLNDAVKGNTSGFPTVMMWLIRFSIIFYFLVTLNNNKPDLVGSASLLICAIIGSLLALDIFGNVLLSIFCGFCVCFAKLQEFSYLKYDLKFRDSNINAFKNSGSNVDLSFGSDTMKQIASSCCTFFKEVVLPILPLLISIAAGQHKEAVYMDGSSNNFNHDNFSASFGNEKEVYKKEESEDKSVIVTEL